MSSRNIEKVYSKNGLPILLIEHEGKQISLHSKYDPMKEAERVLDSYKEQIEEADHILFYGVGLGYHVKLFFERYPEKLASTYEPIADVFHEFTKTANDLKLPINFLEHTFVEETTEQLEQNLAMFSANLRQKVLFIVLPVYEKVASEEYLAFITRYKQLASDKKNTMYAEMAFSQRWTINALMNVKSTFETPNILTSEYNPFVGKPVILAAAGPSLSEEMENLRYIKENGLAYIFAVGSANIALIAQDIYPDAVLTYDPQAHNHTVFHKIIEQNIDTIPMIYGTTVGFETIQMYKGPKFHFVTSQDTVTPYFHDKVFPIINDAGSIAIVTLQLLHKLQAGKVILVGQNFAFKNSLFYSKEIERYDKEKEEKVGADVQKQDLINSFEVEDTLGGKVLTNDSFNRMRLEMEQYIEAYSAIEVINATQGGAAIKGTTYQSLENLLENTLTERVIDSDWYKKIEAVSSELKEQKVVNFQRDTIGFIEKYEVIMNHFRDLDKAKSTLKSHQIQKRLEQFDDLFRRFTNNTFFTFILRPITRIFFEKLQADTKVFRVWEPSKEKVERVIQAYAYYLEVCKGVYKDIAPGIQAVILPALATKIGWKEYGSTSGIFHYEGDWEKQLYDSLEEELEVEDLDEPIEVRKKKERLRNFERANKIPISIYSVGTNKENTKIKFRFSGEKLVLFGKNQSDKVLKLRMTIDNKVTTVKVDRNIDEDMFGVVTRNQIYKTTSLSAGMHNVIIENLSEYQDFYFQGIAIDNKARAYHIHEVTTVEELEIGKRIRCHYHAAYNMVGEFTGLGKESAEHLSIEATKEPNGDFYFIMVDNLNGKEKLIADRNLQNFISWVTLSEYGLNQNTIIESLSLENFKVMMRLIDGGKSTEDTANEWNQYIILSDLNGKILSGNDIEWNWSGKSGTWTNTRKEYKNSSNILMKPIRSRLFNDGQWKGNDASRWVLGTSTNVNEFSAFRPLISLEFI